MISFKAISCHCSGEDIAAYFRNQKKTRETDSPEIGTPPQTAIGGHPSATLAAYYAAGARGVWRDDMSPAMAQILGVDPRRPLSNEELGRLYEGKQADTGATWAGAKTREISAYDFLFHPHKSVSLAAAMAESPAEAAAIREAIARANDDTIRYIAREIGWARKGKNGRDGADPGETAWISFTHHDARPTIQIKDGPEGKTETHEAPVPGDPHEHIHNSFFNLVLTDEGRAGSLDTQRLHSRVHEFGAYAQARLAAELRKLGIRVGYDEKEQAAVVLAIPQIANETFSKSHRHIERNVKGYAKNKGLDWDSLTAKEKLKIIKETGDILRLSKRKDPNQRQHWIEDAQAIGWEHTTVLDDYFPELLSGEQRMEQAYAFANAHLAREFHSAAIIDYDKLRIYAARGLIGTGISSPKDIDRVVDLIEERGIVIDGEQASLIMAETKKSSSRKETEMVIRVTTTAHVRMEQELIAHIQRAAASKTTALAKEKIEAAIAASALDFSSEPEHGAHQIAAIHALGQGGGATLLSGAAGSGKTTLLRPLVAAWKEDQRDDPAGRNILGLSTAWRQATALKDAGIATTAAISPFLKSIAAGKIEANRNTILVIDEVSQIGLKSMLEIFRLQEKTGMTIVSLGDREQAQPIEAGDTVELMRRALPEAARPEIPTTVRQTKRRDRKIASLFRNEESAKALAMKRDDGTARLVGGDYDQVVNEIASLYLKRRDELRTQDPKKIITISAPTNDDAAEISQAIRAKLKARGEIGNDETIYEAIAPRGYGKDVHFNLPIATGDRVRLFSFTWAKIVDTYDAIGHNGDIVEVVGRTDSHISLMDAKGRIGEVEWRRVIDRQTGRLLLGFGHALTIDSAQGITSDEHINALPRGSANITAFKAYVAESRARGTTWTMISEGAVRQTEHNSRPIGDTRSVTNDDLWKRIAKDMADKPYKGLAIDLAEAAAKNTARTAAANRNAKRKMFDSFLRQSHIIHKWEKSGEFEKIAKTAHHRKRDNSFRAHVADRLMELAKMIKQNDAQLQATEASLRNYTHSRDNPYPPRPAAAPAPEREPDNVPRTNSSPGF